MLEADELSADIEAATQAMATEEAAVGEEQRRLEQERDRFQTRVEGYATDRATLVADLTPRLLEMFDTLIRGLQGNRGQRRARRTLRILPGKAPAATVQRGAAETRR